MLGSVDVVIGTVKIPILDFALGNLDQSTCHSFITVVNSDAFLKG